MSTVISRRSFLKCTGASAAAVAGASLLGGCRTNGDDTVVEVKVGDSVNNWNGLGVKLSSVFHMNQDPQAADLKDYEYIGAYVIVGNRSKDKTYVIGAQGLEAINEAYPVPPLENIDANIRALADATPDFTASCDGQSVQCAGYIMLYNSNSQTFTDAESLPPQSSGYVAMTFMVPKGWKQLAVTYVPTFVEDKTLTFIVNAADVVRS